jgi:hypothetical protein
MATTARVRDVPEKDSDGRSGSVDKNCANSLCTVNHNYIKFKLLFDVPLFSSNFKLCG